MRIRVTLEHKNQSYVIDMVRRMTMQIEPYPNAKYTVEFLEEDEKNED